MSLIRYPFMSLARILCYSNCNVIKRYNFKSKVSLENLYPNKSLRLFTPEKIPETTEEKFTGFIPIEKLQLTYSRSSGPGGQNVNTLNSKVDLRFHVKSADWLSSRVKERLLEMNKTKINKDGFLVLKSEKTRSQQLNVADIMQRLRTLIRTADSEPQVISEETEEIIRKRKLKAARLRLQEKRNRSLTKSQRQSPNVEF